MAAVLSEIYTDVNRADLARPNKDRIRPDIALNDLRENRDRRSR